MMQWLFVLLIVVMSALLFKNVYAKMSDEEQQQLKLPHNFLCVGLLTVGFIITMVGIILAYALLMHIGASLVFLGWFATAFISWRNGKMNSVKLLVLLLLGLVGIATYVWVIGGFNKSALHSNLIVSEKNMPNFASSTSDYTVMKSESEAEFEEIWRLYRLQQERPEVDFETKTVLFVGLMESGNCPYELTNEHAAFVSNNEKFQVTLPKQHGACFTNATPRTVVIELDQAASEKLKQIEIVDEAGEKTKISYEDI